MRRILLALVLLAGIAASGYGQTSYPARLTSAVKIQPTLSTGIDERTSGNVSHVLTWTKSGTVSACVLKLQSSVDGVTFGTDVITVADCTGDGVSAITTAYGNFFRINASTLTGSGTLNVKYLAFPTATPITISTTGLATGGKTNNNAVPGATNTGVLPCVANAAAPTYTETFQVTCSTDLSGRTRLVAESGGIKSGAIASGAIASGAVAAGALAAGAGVDGWNITEGTKTDAKCTTSDATSCSMVALLKELAGLAATDPCTGVNKTSAAISITTATTTRIIAPSAGNKAYICFINLGPLEAVADNIALVEGTGGTCGSGTASIIGGTTAAKGWNMAASQGFGLGSGAATIFKTAGTNVDVCLITDSAAEVPGVVTYVFAP